MKGKELLLTPGPVQVPWSVALAGARPFPHHRSQDFNELLRSIDHKLKQVFRTEGTILYFAASGTGAMEACMVNLMRPGEQAIVVAGGKFGERWDELAQAFGIEAHVLAVPWGEAVRPEELAELLAQHPQARTVFTALFETSTATAYDIEALAQVCRTAGALLVVDAISGLGAIPLETDAWGVDVVVGASHKALQTPPGLSFVALSSERAWQQVERAGMASYYWDFRRAKEKLFFTPYTPAVSLLVQLNESLIGLLAEGLECIRARYERYARATRAAAQALGLEVFSHRPGAVCTALQMPPNVDATQVVELLRERYGIWVAGGQQQLKGQIIRIAHVGDITPQELIGTLGVLELVLRELGYSCRLGAGVAQALTVLEDAGPTPATASDGGK